MAFHLDVLSVTGCLIRKLNRLFMKAMKGPFNAQMLAQMLSGLGQSGLAESIADISHAAKIGALPLDQKTQDNLAQASRDVEEMRVFLMQALGLRSD